MHQVYRRIFIVLLSAIIAGCSSGKEEAPDNVLSKDQMVEVMADFQMMEAVVQLKLHEDDSTSINKQALFHSVYEKHRIDREVFDRSFEYYTSDPKLMKDIYDGVLEKLSQKEAELRRKKKGETKKIPRPPGKNKDR